MNLFWGVLGLTSCIIEQCTVLSIMAVLFSFSIRDDDVLNLLPNVDYSTVY